MSARTTWWTAVAALLAACLAIGYLLSARTSSRGGILIQEATADEIDEGTRSIAGRRNDTNNNNSNNNKLEPSKIPHATPEQSVAPLGLGCTDLENLDRDKALVLGHRRTGKGFLTIGILYTSQSEGQSHLNRTLGGLIRRNREPGDEFRVTIVVLISALDLRSQQEARAVVSGFPEQLASGLLQLIRAPKSFYPAARLREPRGQGGSSPSPEELRRVLEGAFLLTYAADSSEYYLQLADNTRADPDFARSIRDFIRRQVGVYWVTLEFGPGDFSGKLLRAEGRDIRQLIYLLMEFNQNNTIGETYDFFKKLNVQSQILRQPPLFQPW